MPVYFVAGDTSVLSPIKIGRSHDVKQRVKHMQTGSPKILYLLGWIISDDDVTLEKSLQEAFSQHVEHGEWFDINHDNILPLLINAGKNGFIAKNAAVFEIVGYDSDAIPEYAGICDWVDLTFDECCPFCGCLCGMQYIEAARMYHCANCQKPTDFPSAEGFE